MDDTLKTLVYGFLGLIVFHAALERRAERDATREVREAFQETGTVRSAVQPSGMFGVLGSRLFAIDVFGSGQRADRLPFVAVPRQGWKGHIRHLRLHFSALTLKGLPVERLEADIPNVTYDLGRALYKDRLVIRGAGLGPAEIRVAPEGLRVFINRKFSRTVSDVVVTFHDGKVAISGNLMLFGAKAPFTAVGELTARSGRYIDLAAPTVEMNGKPLTASVTANLLKQINPVLDVYTDLGLEGYLTLTHVAVGDEAVTIYGVAAIPIQRDLTEPSKRNP